MRARHIAAFLTVTAMVAWAAPARGQTMGTYDTFSAAEIDPTRWRGYEYTIEGTESRVRALKGGYNDGQGYYGESFYGPRSVGEGQQRVISGRARVSLTTSKRGGLGGGYSVGKARAGLRMNHPALAAPGNPLVTTLRALVTVAGVSAEAADPATESCTVVNMARAEVFGHFFNDGSSAGPGDLTGDVFALVALERRVERTSEGDVARNVIEGRIGRCNTPGCRLTWQTIMFDRPWTVGAAHVLTVAWQPASNRFVFTVSGGGVAAESRTLAYTHADSAPPRGYAYDLRVESQPGFGGNGEELIWATASIDARFDNVQLNSAAATAAAR